MKKVPHYAFLLWLLVSIILFVYVLPISTDTLIKLIAGYVFYLLIKEIFYRHFEQRAVADNRINVLHDRIEHSPHKENVYVHEQSQEDQEEKEKEKKQNMGEYV
jgi:hypothetical protein